MPALHKPPRRGAWRGRGVYAGVGLLLGVLWWGWATAYLRDLDGRGGGRGVVSNPPPGAVPEIQPATRRPPHDPAQDAPSRVDARTPGVDGRTAGRESRSRPPRHPTCFEHGVDYHPRNGLPAGAPLDKKTAWAAASPAACQALCAAERECYFWTYDTSSGTCCPKGNLLRHAPDTFWAMAPGFPTSPAAVAGRVSGPKVCPEESLKAFTRADFVAELKKLEACAFDGRAEIAARLGTCVDNATRVVHWQVAHANARYSGTYPRRQWEKCAIRNNCYCHTRVRHGVPDSDRWVVKDMADVPGHTVRCSKHVFIHDPPLPDAAYARDGAPPGGKVRCECETSVGEREGARARRVGYATLTLRRPFADGGSRDGTAGRCEVPIAFFSPMFDRLSLGWGETAAHVVLGLTNHCFAGGAARHVSVASWKQDEKLLQLPCEGLTAYPWGAVDANETTAPVSTYTAGVYSMHAGDNWSWMPLNVSSDVRAAVKALYGADAPAVLDMAGGVKGNRALGGWEARGWNHPCCQYGVVAAGAQRRYAKFVLGITLGISDAAAPAAAATSAAYCLLWRSTGACIPRWYGYVGEVLWVYYLYATHRLLPVRPNSDGDRCRAAVTVRHPLYGSVALDSVDAAYEAALARGGSA